MIASSKHSQYIPVIVVKGVAIFPIPEEYPTF